MSTEKKTHYLSPSILGSYFHNQCDLFLHLMSDAGDRKALGQKEHSERQQAIFGKGLAWESSIVEDLRAAGKLVDCTDKDPLQLLSETDPAAFPGGSCILFHARFTPPDALYRNLDRGLIQFTHFEPDFLLLRRVNDKRVLTVIDAKASPRMKLSHQVQVTFYHLALSYIIEELAARGVTDLQLSNIGGIWRPGSDLESLDEFSIALTRPMLEEFVYARLPAIMSQPRTAVSCHYSAVCASCPFKDHCRENAIRDKDLSCIPYLSASDKRWLCGLLQQERASAESTPLPDLEDLDRLSRPGAPLSPLNDKLAPSVRGRLQNVLRMRTAARPAPLQPAASQASPVLQAQLSGTLQVIGERSLLFPLYEQRAVVLTALTDPLSGRMCGWGLAVFDRDTQSDGPVDIRSAAAPRVPAPSDLDAVRSGFVYALHGVLRASEGKQVQFYVWDNLERSAILNTLVEATSAAPQTQPPAAAAGAAAGAAPGVDTHLLDAASACALALVDDSSAILLSRPPDARVSQAPKAADSVASLRQELARLGLSAGGRKADLQERLDQAVTEQRQSTVRPARVCLLSQAVRGLVSLPVPGWYELRDCLTYLAPAAAAELSAPFTQEAMFDLWKTDAGDALETTLRQRMCALNHIVTGLRSAVAAFCSRQGLPLDSILLNDAPPLESVQAPAARSVHVRRLLFVKQYEALRDWLRLREERAVGSGMARLRFDYYDSKTRTFVFAALEGAELLEREASNTDSTEGGEVEAAGSAPAEGGERADAAAAAAGPAFEGTPQKAKKSGGGFSMSPWLISPAGSQSPLPPYLCFSDVVYHDKIQFAAADTIELQFASVADIVVPGSATSSTRVMLKLARLPKGVDALIKFKKGDEYPIMRRHIDFNLTRVLAALRSLDSAPTPPLLLRLLDDPTEWGESLPDPGGPELERRVTVLRQLYEVIASLRPEQRADRLLMKRSQASTFDSILSHRLQLVWGPPGTGKTHFLALTMLRLAAATAKMSDTRRPFRILVTAFTHTAIDELLQRVQELLQVARGIAEEEKAEWRDMFIVHKMSSTDKAGDAKRVLTQSPYCVMGGTVWAIYKHLVDYTDFDMLVIDEGSQLPVADAALALDKLRPAGRLVIGGDHLQLAPIVKAKYPAPRDRDPPLHGSVLQCLMRDDAGRAVHPLRVAAGEGGGRFTRMLEENFRMNGDLCSFTKSIYGARYDAQNPGRRVRGDASRLTDPALDGRAARVVQRLLPPHAVSMIAVNLATAAIAPCASNVSLVPYERLVAAEAAVVGSIVQALLTAVDWEADAQAPAAGATTPDQRPSIFIITPHRVQRAAVTRQLHSLGIRNLDDNIDTVERMQGREVDIVLVCYGFLDPDRIQNEMDFLYNRNRLNVSITRARKACLLLVTDAVLRPSMTVLETEERRAAFEHLHAFVHRAAKVDYVLSLESA